MIKIAKYNIIKDEFSLDIPSLYQLLSVQTVNYCTYLYVLIDDSLYTITRYFKIFATYEEIENDVNFRWEYITTFNTGSNVYHLFEKIQTE